MQVAEIIDRLARGLDAIEPVGLNDRSLILALLYTDKDYGE
jgi:hypothetical protein